MSGRSRTPATALQTPTVQTTSSPVYAESDDVAALRDEFHQFKAVAEVREKFNTERIAYIAVIVALFVAFVSYAVLH